MLFDDVMKIYMDAKTHRSKDRDLRALGWLQPYFSGRRISELRRSDVRGYVTHRKQRGVCEATVLRELRVFSAAINFARVECEDASLPNPVRNLGLSSGDRRVRWLTQEEASALVCAAQSRRRPHLAAFIKLALGTGCRKNELLGLEWRRVDFAQGMFWLDAHHTKNGKRRVVPLNPLALEALVELEAWGQVNSPGARWVFAMEGGNRRTSLQETFRRACCQAGISDFRIHDMRHTFASWLVMQGVSLYVVKDLLGHSSISITERYAHLSPDQGRLAVQKISLC
ncbi:tyrosine-type recombinase/integrase [Pandoraea apista]|uniref:tyrosine-type recombinase/integrase n=1 Tax=Pandoraea apista TaxID=93218 RepID=UPI000F65CE12|nr:site-specific integrase [Pandoraea apista]RRW91051.1 site-specific integrase [Pandoraea apista]RRX00842.1 site-specific integrase [Pandoraea apista]